MPMVYICYPFISGYGGIKAFTVPLVTFTDGVGHDAVSSAGLAHIELSHRTTVHVVLKPDTDGTTCIKLRGADTVTKKHPTNYNTKSWGGGNVVKYCHYASAH